MYTLYFSPGAASMCVHQALLEIGAPFQAVLIDIDSGAQRDPSYLKINPAGLVPSLMIDGAPYAEAAALLLTLAARHPEARLMPSGESPLRASWNQWMVYLANTLQPAFRLWFYPTDISAEPAVQEALKRAVRERIEGIWQRLADHLAGGGPYLLGTEFSCADLYLIMLLRWSRNMPKPATEWPALRAYCNLLCARQSWKRLCAAEGLSEWMV